MKTILKYFILLAFIMVSGSAVAQKAPKFGYINTTDLIQAMPDRDSAQVKLEALGKELEATLETLQVELRKKYDAYQKEEKNLTDLVKQTRIGEIQDFEQRVQTFQQQADQQLQQKNSELMQPIIAKAKKAIEDVAKENGFTGIFEATALQYMGPDLQDVLPLVKTKLGIKATVTAPKK